jgi:tetratricopeptide (TPR) repeat protein
MSDTPRFHAFLCHAGADKPAVHRLHAALQAAGLRAWLDEEEIGPGASVIGSTQEGLAASDHVLVCLSAGFAVSKWVQKAWQSVLHQQLSGRPGSVLPVLVADCPDSEIPLFLADLRREDVRSGPGLDRLVAFLGKQAAPSAPTPKPRGAPTEVRLKLENVSGSLRATWIRRDSDNPSFPFSTQLTAADLAEHRWYLEEYLDFPGPGDRARAGAFEHRLTAFGAELHAAIQANGGADALRDLMAAPEPRLLTLTSDDADALALPWELLRDGQGPLVFRDLVLRRRLHGTPPPAVAPAASLPLRVLLVVARPTDVSFIDPRSSAGPLLDALDQLGGLVRVEMCDPPTLAELDSRLDAAKDRGEGFHLVHFDGHGVYLPQLGVGALCFEKADGTNDLVKGPDLGDLLQRMRVPVALLEACQTADLACAPVFGSVAPALLKSGVGSVVAFSHAVLVSASRILIERFYKAVCKGKSIGEALNAGRRALHADPVRAKTRAGDLTLRDWHIAELYQVGEDPVLVPGGAPASVAESAPLQRGRAPGKEFGVAPMYGFHGRARELLALQRKLRQHGAVVVTGMGGMGKTSLAREAAHWWHRIGLRPGGAAFFSFETRQGADRAVAAFVSYLEGDAFVPGSPEALWERAVGLFRTRDVLWVWDNFESTLPQYQKGTDAGLAFPEEERDRLARLFGALRDTTGGKPRGWLVVTCRPEGTGLGGIAEMGLGGLAKGDALAMTRKILELKEVPVGAPGYEREAVDELLKTLEGHPLSIELVMPHLKQSRPAEVGRNIRTLMAGMTQEAGEGRNRSLMASLRYSTERLSDEARGVLPYLAWFDGGAFEKMILDFSGMASVVWANVRTELLTTALVWVDDEVVVAARPYIHFHPTLPLAAQPQAVADEEEARKRFVESYCELAAAAANALHGSEPASGMAVMGREEANLGRAAALAFEIGSSVAGARLAQTIGTYLAMTGRTRDHARLTAWVQGHMAGAVGPARWQVERSHAWGLFLAGKRHEAVVMLERQLEMIERVHADVRQRANCQSALGRILVQAGQHGRALHILEKAIEGLEAAGEFGNMSVALGEQANALMRLGRLSEALASAERSVAIDREHGNARNLAAGLGRIAAVLSDQYRFREAEERLEEALRAAGQARDTGLEGTLLQHLGTVFFQQGDHGRAATRYKEALALFQAVENRVSEMRTADLLGSAEAERGQHEAARAWYMEAERLARILGDDGQLAATSQNMGILLQQQALRLPAEATAARRHLLSEAVVSVTLGLTLERGRGNEVGAAGSHSQLGVIYRELGVLDEAERCTREALAVRERLNLPEVYKDYRNLEEIAIAGDHADEAAAWRAKKEAKLTELGRLAQGDGAHRLPPAMRDAFLSLCRCLHAALGTRQPIPPDAVEAIATLLTRSAPLAAAGRFLQAVAAGHHPPVPENVPPELAEIFSALLEALPVRGNG